MSLNASEISAAVDQICDAINRGEVHDIHEPQPGEFVLMIGGGEKTARLLISLQAKFSRIHLRTRRVKARKSLGRFAAALRNHLRGAIVDHIEQHGGDRIVKFDMRASDGSRLLLIAELMGPASNLFVLDAEGRIVLMFSDRGSAGREFALGADYAFPQSPKGAKELVRTEFAGTPDYSEAVERFYDDTMLAEAFRNERVKLMADLKSRRKKLRRKVGKIREDLLNCSQHDELLRKAELLKANIHKLKRGLSVAVIVDYYDSAMPEIEIPLDPKVPPKVSMERMFKQAAKRRIAMPIIEKRLEGIEDTLVKIEQAICDLETVENLEGVAQIKTQVGSARSKPARKRRKKTAEALGPRSFVSAEGMEILVGRSSRDNDMLTKRIARGNDMWMHVQNRQGSHVVIRIVRGKNASLETLLDGANLAVYYSKVRGSSKVPVDYTYCKYVRKPKGAVAGYVIYSQNKTLMIDPDDARLARLLGADAAS